MHIQKKRLLHPWAMTHDPSNSLKWLIMNLRRWMGTDGPANYEGLMIWHLGEGALIQVDVFPFV